MPILTATSMTLYHAVPKPGLGDVGGTATE